MTFARAFTAFAMLGIAACGQAAMPIEAEAQTVTAAELSAADRSAILQLQNLRADTRGMVENECGERVAPQFHVVDLGGAVGAAALLVMSGGPNSATCYGDGPGLTLLKREGPAWRAIYNSRGAFLAVLPTRTRGVADLATAGPGFEHPLWTWNGTTYASTNRTVADAQIGNATILP